MTDLVHRILGLYRPVYLRGLMMDGQYRLPARQTARPSHDRPILPKPAFDPGRQRVLTTPALAGAGRRALSPGELSDDLNGA